MKNTLFLLALGAVLPCAAAAADRYVRADEVVANAAQVADQTGKKLRSPVQFPSVLPSQPDPLYAYAEADQKTGNYTIYMDSRRDCNGAHYCNIGALQVSKGHAPAHLRDLDGNDITTDVRLSNGERAYFTPGHALGDYWPAQIQWTRDGVLYSLSWSGKFPDGERQTMMKMADSVGPT